MEDRQQRFQEFDALRGLSIVLLLILHSHFFALKFFGVELGPMAAFVGAFLLGSFFFLAGYFTDISLSRSGNNVFVFVKSKLIRIFPPYWLALALFMIVMGYSLKRLDLYVYAMNLQIVFSPAYVKQLLTLWYISLLIIYYMIFVPMLLLTKANKRLLAGSVVVFTTAYGLHLAKGFFDQRFFQYYFLFLAGIYFSRFKNVRRWLFDLAFLYKFIISILGVLVFWLVQLAGYEVRNGLYLLAVDFFILGWVLMWLTIFRMAVGGWRLWSFLSTASFFAYLYHRPVWQILMDNFDVTPWGGFIYFQLFPGSIVTLVLSYFLQRGYDLLLSLLRLK
jgi:peptidoglycan/LPS O-acetylase OafA/YrhL